MNNIGLHVDGKSKFELVITWYNEPNETRLEELIYCLKKNSEAVAIKKIHVLIEQLAPFNLPSELNKENIVTHVISVKQRKAISFFDLLHYAHKNIAQDQKIIISNNDIYFDSSLLLAKDTVLDSFIFGLTRYNIFDTYYPNGDPWLRKDWSQDSWVFKNGKLPLTETLDINLGWLGSDNRLAFEIDKLGLKIVNPSDSIKSYHYHKENQHQKLTNKYSYRQSGKGMKYLKILSLETLLSPDYLYESLSPTNQKDSLKQMEAYDAEQRSSVISKGITKFRNFLKRIIQKTKVFKQNL